MEILIASCVMITGLWCTWRHVFRAPKRGDVVRGFLVHSDFARSYLLSVDVEELAKLVDEDGVIHLDHRDITIRPHLERLRAEEKALARSTGPR